MGETVGSPHVQRPPMDGERERGEIHCAMQQMKEEERGLAEAGQKLE